MKFNFSSIEVEYIHAGINNRISSYADLNSKSEMEKEQIDRLMELKNKIALEEQVVINGQEKSLLTGIINSEVWKKYDDLYNRISQYSSLKYFTLTMTEKAEIELLEKLTRLSNRLNKSNYYNQKESFVWKMKFHEKLKLSIDGKWYYSHSQGKLYKTAIQINEKEYAEIKLNEKDVIADLKFFPVNMSYLSSFMQAGTKSDILKLTTDYQKYNELDNNQEFIVKMIMACR